MRFLLILISLCLNSFVMADSSQSIVLPSGTKLHLAKHSVVKFSDDAVVFLEGILRVEVKKKREQVIQGEGVTFTGNGATFEVSQSADKNIDLDVIKGEVTVASPYVQTFVPEIVKANEGFTFNTKTKSFSRRKFELKKRPR